MYNRCSIDYQREVLKIREIQYVYSLIGRMIICDTDNNSYGIISYKKLTKFFNNVSGGRKIETLIDLWLMLLKV